MVKTWHDKFADAVGNDVNTAMGLTLVYDVLKADLDGATTIAIINDYDSVLGLKLLEKTENENAPAVDPELAAYVEEMIAKRAEAKKAKDFALADSIRDELKEKGVVIKDTREGARWNLA